MRINGTISFQITISGGRNRFGEPIPATTEWSEPINCSIKTNSDNRKGKYEDGEFRQASFVALIEAQDLPTGIKRLHLTRYTEDLGEFEIISIEPILTMGRIQITV